MRCETWTGLEVRIVGGPDREGGGAGPVVLLMHGFGAPGDDLVALWRMLDVPEDIRFVFPAAPLVLNLGFGESRAWWMLDMERLTQKRAQGDWDELTKEIPVGLHSARDQLLRFLDEMESRLPGPAQHLVIGGFSQGAMLACDLVLRTKRPLAGLVLLSASVIARDDWVSLIPNRQGLRVFQSHGTDDPLLSCHVAQQLRDALTAGGIDVEWHEFRGGHEIPMQVLDRLGHFIRTIFPESGN